MGVARPCNGCHVASYQTFAQAHKNVPAAVAWVDKILAGVDPDRIISITQSTTSDSGPGYGTWYMTTMIVIRQGD